MKMDDVLTLGGFMAGRTTCTYPEAVALVKASGNWEVFCEDHTPDDGIAHVHFYDGNDFMIIDYGTTFDNSDRYKQFYCYAGVEYFTDSLAEAEKRLYIDVYLYEVAYIAIYLSYVNQFLTVNGFSQHYGITNEEGAAIIEYGREQHEKEVARKKLQ